MSEKNVVEKTKQPLTKQDIKAFLRRLGIKNDDTLVVHSSLSKLGFVIGSVQAVLEALNETVKDGTIVMPAHTGDNSDPREFQHPPIPESWHALYREHYPAFNKETSPLRGMGKIATQFLAMKDTLRSNHPVVSFTAKGKMAEHIAADQPLSPMFGLDSPLGRVYRAGGKILLLGSGFETCSAFHVSEILSGVVGKTDEQAAIIKNGLREWVTYEDYEYDEDDFKKVGERLRSTHIVTTYKIGLGDAHIMDIKEAVDEAARIIKDLRTTKEAS